MIWSTADNPKYESGKKLFLRICNELLAYIFQKPERAGGGLAEWLIKSLLKSASSEQQQKKQGGGVVWSAVDFQSRIQLFEVKYHCPRDTMHIVILLRNV